MRPLSVLLAIVTGSAVALAVGLSLTWVCFLFMPQHAARIAPEKGPLVEAILLFTLLSSVSGAALYGELGTRKWRRPALVGMLAVLSLTFWVYWPR